MEIQRVERYTVTIANASISKSTRTPSISGNAAGRRNSVSGIQTVKTVNQLRRMGRLPDIRMDETVAILMLLITVHSAVHVSEYLQLVNPLWQIYCMDSRPKVAASAAFLFVKCADLAPKTIHNLVTTDLTRYRILITTRCILDLSWQYANPLCSSCSHFF